MQLSRIHVFPVKSLAGLRRERWRLDARGLAWDRHWMVVTPDGKFLTQRQAAVMSQIHTRLEHGRLWLSHAAQAELAVPASGGERRPVQVWGDTVEAEDLGDACAGWLAQAIGQPCRLVVFPHDVHRAVDPAYATPQDQVGFADGFPLLLLSEATLLDIKARIPDCDWTLDQLVRRFRPNLVVSGTEPYAEDQWRRIRIGGIDLRVVKPCSRCVIPTIDPDSGEKGREPVPTLAQYRRRADGAIYVGQNVIHDAPGELAVGMDIELLESEQ